MKNIISLVGMSNTGKTFWSKKLAQERGYNHINCDDEIEALLDEELSALGLNGINGVAEWMGQPYESRFKNAQDRYMELENKVMSQVLDRIKNSDSNTVIDTTGSVIYCSSDILKSLRQHTHVICITTPKSHHEPMFQSYIGNPKPVIWGESFDQKTLESNLEALSRCYPKLLQYRAKGYSALADTEIQLPIVRTFTTAKQLISHIHDPL